MKMGWKFSCIKMISGFCEFFTCTLRDEVQEENFQWGNFSFYFCYYETLAYLTYCVAWVPWCLISSIEMYLKVYSKEQVPCEMKTCLVAVVLSLLRMNECLELVFEEHLSKFCLTFSEGLHTLYHHQRKRLSTCFKLHFICFTEMSNSQ